MTTFSNFSIFQVSLFELARNPEFPSLPVIPEDFVKDHGAKYSCKFKFFPPLVISHNFFLLITFMNSMNLDQA